MQTNSLFTPTVSTYSQTARRNRDSCGVGCRSTYGTRDRAGMQRSLVPTLGVVQERPRTSHTGGSLEEEADGERLEAVESVAEVGELQLRLKGAVEEAALSRLAAVIRLGDILVVKPKTLRRFDTIVFIECDTGNALEHREVCRDRNTDIDSAQKATCMCCTSRCLQCHGSSLVNAFTIRHVVHKITLLEE